ncbi:MULTISPECIES: hypothetical protein [unclassified Crossiella]|uniref:hypothetical protein n=1 Tax=unclassified Crossiella TaxID=2620835 RepID=UPI001FFE7BBA|nr:MULTISPECIES: hypothetical protein [unclassified Crossiella]MCK2243868.1 hypothetical protein [Crossiella sp. S99.2]MCK2257274.1 hypothetical protein [Crossiella sp. S99.1]
MRRLRLALRVLLRGLALLWLPGLLALLRRLLLRVAAVLRAARLLLHGLGRLWVLLHRLGRMRVTHRLRWLRVLHGLRRLVPVRRPRHRRHGLGSVTLGTLVQVWGLPVLRAVPCLHGLDRLR